VVVGVLTWNGHEKARACIDSLRLLRGWPVPVVVVDNGSREREGERLATEFGPPVEAVSLPVNRAVAGGYNAALKWAADRGATHILLLNNDTLISDPGMLDRLVAATGPDVAAVGPLIRNGDGSTYSAGGRISWVTGLSGHRHAPLHINGPYSAPWLDGPCVLVSLDAVRRIGGLDPIFVSYWEDVDWCTRAVRAGYTCLVEPRTSVVHLRGGTIPSPEAEASDLRNGILFIRRHGSRLSNLTSLAFFILVRSPIHIARRAKSAAQLSGALRAVRRAAAWNARDAAQHGRWRVPADGPSLEDMPAPIE
jgi:hypothetical protein